MDFSQILTQILPLFENHPWFNVATSVVTLASALTAVTSTPKGKITGILYKGLEIFALNIGKAKDK